MGLAKSLVFPGAALVACCSLALAEARDPDEDFQRKPRSATTVQKSPAVRQPAPRPLKKPVSVNKQDRLDAGARGRHGADPSGTSPGDVERDLNH